MLENDFKGHNIMHICDPLYACRGGFMACDEQVAWNGIETMDSNENFVPTQHCNEECNALCKSLLEEEHCYGGTPKNAKQEISSLL